MLNFESATTALGGRRISFGLDLDGKADSVATPSAGTRASARSTSARPARRSRSAAATRRPRGSCAPRACGWPRAGRHTRSSRWTSSSSYPGAAWRGSPSRSPRTSGRGGSRARSRARSGQTFGDLVVEVHDDATPGDAVARVVERLRRPARDSSIRYEDNAGIVGNFTRSLLGADTEYVIQLGDDDEAHPRLVEKTVAALDAHPSAGVAHARFELIDAEGETLVAERDVLGTPLAAARAGRRLRREVDGPRLPDLQLDGADPPLGGAGGRVPGRSTSRPFDFAFWLRIARGLGRRVHRRAAVPLPASRAEPHVGARRAHAARATCTPSR